MALEISYLRAMYVLLFMALEKKKLTYDVIYGLSKYSCYQDQPWNHLRMIAKLKIKH